MPTNEKPEYNEALVRLASPILLNMPVYFGSNVFDRESVKRVLITSNCPSHLTDEVIDNCELAGVVSTTDNGNTVTIITQSND